MKKNAIRVLPLGGHGVLFPIGRFHGHICKTCQFGIVEKSRKQAYSLHEKHKTCWLHSVFIMVLQQSGHFYWANSAKNEIPSIKYMYDQWSHLS